MAPTSERQDRPAADLILRFRASERHLHWAIAIPFMACFATAFVLFLVYNLNPARPYRSVFSAVHKVAGLCLIVCPTIVIVRHRQDFRAHLYNIRQGWVWTLNDVKWLCLMGLAAVSSKFELPEQGKFNAAEKLNFMMVMTFSPLLIVTGILIWLPGSDLLAWFVHMALAALATPLMIGHIFMATINPETRVGLQGMITGWVDRQWARHHYRRWYRENFEDDPVESPAEPAPTPDVDHASPHAVVAHCPSCHWRYSLAAWGELVHRVFSGDSIPCPRCGAELQALAVVTEPRHVPSMVAEPKRGSPDVAGIEPRSPFADARADAPAGTHRVAV